MKYSSRYHSSSDQKLYFSRHLRKINDLFCALSELSLTLNRDEFALIASAASVAYTILNSASITRGSNQRRINNSRRPQKLHTENNSARMHHTTMIVILHHIKTAVYPYTKRYPMMYVFIQIRPNRLFTLAATDLSSAAIDCLHMNGLQ